jgi:MFS family permease
VALAFTREPPRGIAAPGPVAPPPPPAPATPRPSALGPITLFAFANATDAFILVKAAHLGAPPLTAPLLWLALHVVKATTATPGGRLADRWSKRGALALGWTVYAVTWSAGGWAGSLGGLFILTAAYGTSHGLVEGAEKALIAELAPASARGRAFGTYHLAVGLAALAASPAFGLTWDRLGDEVAFTASGLCALAAAGWLLATGRRR